jgi:hypothetical protein
MLVVVVVEGQEVVVGEEGQEVQAKGMVMEVVLE